MKDLFFLLVAFAALAPARTLVVNQRHPAAEDSGPATEQQPLRTIARAAALAQPGDTVLVHAGVYRERVTPARGGELGKPITYEAAPDETVIVKGSDVWKPEWQTVEGRANTAMGRFAPGMFGDYNPYRIVLVRGGEARPAPGPRFQRTLGQVFVDGEPYSEQETLDDVDRSPATWMATPAGDGIYIHFTKSHHTPAERVVEISVRERIFAPETLGLGYIHIRGFIFEHAANQFPWPEHGAVSTRSGHHWKIENNTVRFAKSTGLWAGSDAPENSPQFRGRQPPPDVVGYHLVRNNHITDNGVTGLMGILQTGTVVTGNVVERNNFLGIRMGEDAGKQAGIKFLNFYKGTIEGNLIRDNDNYGIWLDRAWDQSRITRNIILNSMKAGIYIELGHGPLLIDNNVIGYTRAGDGIATGDSSNITIAHNLLYGNAGFGVFSEVETDRRMWGIDRPPAIVEASNIRVVWNLFIGNYNGAIGLPYPWQRARETMSDCNAMNLPRLQVAGARASTGPMFLYNNSKGHVKQEVIDAAVRRALNGDLPQYLSLEQWRTVSGNDAHSYTFGLRFPMLRTRTVDLELDPDAAFFSGIQPNACPAVAGVDRDLFGDAMGARRLPGPWQSLSPGRNRVSLWPLR